ncbi:MULTISPECIES: Pls/PosA family non-ribosomal peptide synthetase [unclassified Amycolatopsis]|uniref:Pls/PosA family non-ribosomal peptide synthetase n=1 Tax=unclassified Amycolatopsis TaxID=2618356 RepID=UPI002875ADEF|nr:MULTISPECIES: Pls/PosA family non-ribosomal peptide synthetase [unclassified Amycolatopsis]MDS0135579.1 amino acid adenylation domain-containing protein [Amycolatopsis sp. 505]MDS0148405.1 amino acid adenylation domain-containing protein [Amycolatopsis sp. CM201R]
MTVTIEPTGTTPEVTLAPVADRALFWSGLGAGERTLLDVLAATAERHPNAAAIDDGTTTLTYRRLLEEIDAYGRRLRGYGVGLGDRVGIRISSGTAELYIAILATLSVGAAYVPVDADDPDERAELVFEEAQVAAVATDGTINVHSTPGGREGRPGPADDAWIIFTSGSTGKPKGVAVTHASAAAFVDAEAELFLTDEPIGPGDRVLAGLSVAFDASCEEMWLAWRHGACLVPAPRALVRTGVDLGPWLVAQRITVVSTVPTLAALWPADALEDVRLLIFGGEACPPELAERVAVEGREVWNTYGPTEATVVACAAQLTGEGPVRIGLPLVGWQLAVVNDEGEPVAMGETGELVIGGVGLARYLDAAKDAEKFAPLPSLGWQRAYRSGDMVRAEEEGLLFLGRLDEQVKLGGRRIELGEVDAALQALPGVQGAAAAIRRTKAGNQVLVGYVVPAGGDFDHDQAASRLREHLPAALVPLLAVVDDLPTRTSGKVDRNALPWPLSTVEASGLTPTETWLAEGWAEILGVSVDSPKADFFTHGGGSLTAAQVVARIRTRHPQVSVADIYAHPRLGALAAMLDALSGQATERRDIAPTKRRAGVVQTLLMVPLMGLVGLRWVTLSAALSNVLSLLGFAWAPTLSWAWLGLAWVVLFSPAGRIAIAAGGARVLLSGVRPGTYPRGGSVHLRLWTAEKLAEFSGADSVAGASWMTTYAKALGARIGKDVDLHSPPPVTGFLKLGRGAAIEPEVDLSGHWVDGDVVHIGKVRVGAEARVGARSTLFPGARIGKGAEIAAGSTVRGAVPAGQRWAGSPATRVGKDERDALKWPSSRPPRSHFWAAVYGATSLALGFLPGVAALAGVAVLGYGIAGAPTLVDAFTRALVFVPAATAAYFLAYMLLVLVGVRALSIGMVEGYHPVHGRVAWQVWATERLMSMAREGLFPLYASLFTPVWLRLLGAKVGRNVEASTVLALPKMTKVDSGAFLADDTMVATYELNHGWLHVAPARIGKQAFLGNSGMTAPGRSVPKRGLVGVLSSTPLKAKKGSSYLGMPPLPVRRAVGEADTSRTYTPALHLKAARALVELCRIIPVMCGVALTVVVAFGLLWTASAFGFGVAALLAGPALLAAGIVAALTATVMKWLLVGKFREVDHPLWSSFVWRNELADTFVEAFAVPWLIGSVGGTPLLTAWLRTMGVKIGRGVWLETYWLPEADLVELGDGATINRGCVVQTHLFHDRIMSMSRVTLGEGATLGPHGIVLPGAGIGARTTVGPGSLVTRGDEVPADTRWLGNPISAWPGK